MGAKISYSLFVLSGENMAGRNASWFNDGGAFVVRSVEVGKPFVFVSSKSGTSSDGAWYLLIVVATAWDH